MRCFVDLHTFLICVGIVQATAVLAILIKLSKYKIVDEDKKVDFWKIK